MKKYDSACSFVRVRRVRVFESGVLRTMFGPVREEVAGDWRRLHNEGIRDS